MGEYTFFGWIRLAWEVVLTRIFQSRARLIRRPFYLRGARNVNFGRNITIGRNARIEAYGEKSEINIIFGSDVEINDYVHIAAAHKVTLGDRVLVASRVFITDHNHGAYNGQPVMMRASARASGRQNVDAGPLAHSAPDIPPAERPLTIAPVKIGDDVWLGQGACILPGVTIGKGSII